MTQDKDNKKNNWKCDKPGHSNDQLGENASEEFRSEHYANACKNEKHKKHH